MHPLAYPTPNGAACGMKAGDRVRYKINQRIGIADEFLSDGDAFVTWDDGTFGTVKWNNLTKIGAESPPPEHKGLPVHGYQPQSDAKVALVNGFKQDEERLLRRLDEIGGQTIHLQNDDGTRRSVDPRWLAIARTGFEQGFMALNRSVFQPQRVKLPEDDVEAALERADLP